MTERATDFIRVYVDDLKLDTLKLIQRDLEAVRNFHAYKDLVEVVDWAVQRRETEPEK